MSCQKTAMSTPIQSNTQIPAVREQFARRLKELRIPRGFPTARSLSRALGIDENRYTRYERAEVEPDLNLLIKICGLLRVSPNDLLVTGAAPNGFSDQDQAPLHGQPGPAPAPQRAPPQTAHQLAPKLAPTVNGAGDNQRRRAVAWRLADELVTASDTVGADDLFPASAGVAAPTGDIAQPLMRIQRVSRLFGDIEADGFSVIMRFSTDARFKTLDGTSAKRIARLFEDFVAINAEVV
jgi:transcriptional regulator with XRE-family HTH domain